MEDILEVEILKKTLDDLTTGVGIFRVHDLNSIDDIQYIFMNKVILYEMRKNREEVFGKRIKEVAPEAYDHEGGLFVMETYRRIAAEGGSVNLGLVEYSNHMVAGTYECSVHHIKDNYVYVMLRNVTELEKTKNELELKNQELSQFAYIVSHDLKEPLQTIYNMIPLIEDEYQEKLDDEALEMLRYISKSTQRMKCLIQDILDYSKLGEGKEMVSVNCNEQVEIVKRDLSSKINETKSKIEIGELPTIQGYETELRMLFQNIIANAIKYSKPNVQPEIKIYAEEKDGWQFSIEDNGIGIADEHKDKIFSVFQRLHGKGEYEGTGIGLAHCKKIVDLHKGSINVESTPGKGSKFIFTIPKN
jgi:light-regulated signal transduction histidine kinase (bacteriophytochrome)